MQHTVGDFLRPSHVDLELDEVVEEWLEELTSRPVSDGTVKHYRKAMLSFKRSLTLHDCPLTLASVNESNILRWKTDMRAGKIQPAMNKTNNFQRKAMPVSAATIRGYVSVAKVFANRWLKRRYTAHDLLELVETGKEVIVLKEAFTATEIARMAATVDGGTFEHVRDRAFIQLLLATGCRFKEVYGLSLDTVDVEAKRVWVVLKGGRKVPVDVDGKALRDFKVYLVARRKVAGDATAVWLSDGGKPLTYWGAYGIFARLEERSGVACNPHKFRHTLAQVMASGSAPMADIQAVLHHSTDHMSRRYVGEARMDVEAGLAKKWSQAV